MDKTLKTNEPYAKFKKYSFWLTEIIFLGHIISKEGVAVDPFKVDVASMWIPPASVTEVRSFLGFTGYDRRYIEGFSKIAKSLTRLTQKAVKFEWTDECQESFNQLKESLTSAPVLVTPSGSDNFAVYCDASKNGLGCVLT